MSHNTHPTRLEFRCHLIFKKKALMPATYYMAFFLPVFNKITSVKYHNYLDFLMGQAHKDGFIEILQVNQIRNDDKLTLTDYGKEFLHWGRFTDVLIEKKSKKINMYLAIWGAIGGIFILVLFHQVYGSFIQWLATI